MRDIRLSKEMGFNGARKYHKIEAPRYPYHADRMGFLVWTEAVLRDYNHPCIVAWVPLNESCGVDVVRYNREEQAHSQVMYYLTESRLGLCLHPALRCGAGDQRASHIREEAQDSAGGHSADQ